MFPINRDIQIIQGATWNPVLSWLSADPTHKIITNVAIGLPTIVTATAHGLTGTARIPVWITNAQGPRGLNTDDYRRSCPRWATMVDADTLAIDFDSGALSPYVAGGVLTYYAPIDLSAWSAVQTLFDAPGATVPVNTIDNASNGGITLGSDGTIKRVLSAAQTAALASMNGWYRLDLTDPNGIVTRFAEGAATVAADADA